jgi:histone H3/H4
MSESPMLVVAAKVKAYVKERTGMSTSAAVMPVLSAVVAQLLDAAMTRATGDGRKTVKDRDIVLPPEEV